MRAPAPTQKDDQRRDILLAPDAPVRRLVDDLLHPALRLHPLARHLARVEARRDRVRHDAPRPQLHRQVLGHVDGGGFRGAVGVGADGAGGADFYAAHRGGDDDVRGREDGGGVREEGGEFLGAVEDGFDVEVEDFVAAWGGEFGGLFGGFEG